MNMGPGKRKPGLTQRLDGSDRAGVGRRHLRKFVALLQRRLLMMALVACAVTAALFALHTMQPPKYAATSIVLLEPKWSAGSGGDIPRDELASILTASHATLFRSPALIAQVVDRLRLSEDPEWNSTLRPESVFTSIMSALHPILRAVGVAGPEKTNAAAVKKAVAQKVARSVKAKRKGASLLIEVTATTANPLQSAAIANALAELYLDEQLSAMLSPAPSTAGLPPLAGARQVAEASVPANAETHDVQAFALSAAFGALLGFAFGCWLDVLDQGVGGLKDAMRKTGRNALASAPLLRPSVLKNLPEGLQNAPGYVVAKPMSAYAESIRNLRTALMYGVSGDHPKVLCVTSARHHEGKTALAISLARVAAMAGQKVLLVNCDLRRRSLNEVLGVKSTVGLLDVVTGDVSWRTVIVKDEATGLDILPGAESFFHPREIFGSLAMQQVMNEFRAEYNLIVLDAPPVLAVLEARIISRLADQTIMVVHWTKTPATLVKSAIELLETTGSSVAGLVLNFVDPRKHGRLTVADSAYQAKYATRYYAS